MGGMLFVLGMAFVVGFLLIFATSLSGKRQAARQAPAASPLALPFDRLVRVCQELIEAMKLEVTTSHQSPEDRTVDFYAENPTPITGGRYLIHCMLGPPDQIISAAEIVELSNAIIQDRLSKGIFITTARFTDDLPAIAELAPIEFIDGRRLIELAAQHRIPLQIPA